MKNFRKVTFLLTVTIALITAGCGLFPDEDEKCFENNWDTEEEPVINVRMTAASTSFTYNMTTYDITLASSLTVTGYIVKVYCSGKMSSSFDINATLLPSNGAIPVTNVKVAGPFQFKFQNDEDRVEVTLKIRASFADGMTFETNEVWDFFAFQDISLNVNSLEYYVLFTIPAGQSFTRVN